MKILAPCAGRSSRFPDMPPKWMLPDHDGKPMLVSALSGLRVDSGDIVITILREHEERFGAIRGLRRAFEHATIVVLDSPTRSQSETVVETLRRTGVDEPFLVKDADNYFELSPIVESYNYVSVASLNDFDSINPRNKSYVQIDQENMITNFREKVVISDLFSVGGYWFTSPSDFLAAYDSMMSADGLGGELYLSEIIGFMALHGDVFKVRRVANYQDWGTVHEWKAKLEARRLLLVSIDGFLFERGSTFFSPSFEQVRLNAAAAAAVRRMSADGDVIAYLSIRPARLEQLTRSQLAAHELPDGNIMFDCPIAQWAVLTASHATLPFSTSDAFELGPEDPNLVEKLRRR